MYLLLEGLALPLPPSPFCLPILYLSSYRLTEREREVFFFQTRGHVEVQSWEPLKNIPALVFCFCFFFFSLKKGLSPVTFNQVSNNIDKVKVLYKCYGHDIYLYLYVLGLTPTIYLLLFLC